MAAPAAADGGASEADRAHMRRAIELSRRAGLEERTGKCFGAVIVDAAGRVVSEGTNQVVSKCDPTWHAELAAIREATGKLGTTSLEGCTLYASTLPCPMCTGAIYWARIGRVFYGADGEDMARHGVFETGNPMQVLFHGREDCLPPGERRGITFTQVMRGEAAAVHEQYGALPPDRRILY